MLFHTSAFAIFLICLLFVFFALKRRYVVPFLVLASFVFYGFSGVSFVGILLLSSCMDFGLGLMVAAKSERVRRFSIILSAITNFGLLGYFKYANFFSENAHALTRALGFDLPPFAVDVILPVGISFYTFHSFAYLVDVATRKIEPCRNIFDFLLFVSWFPQLVAGPIARADHLLPELQKIQDARFSMFERIPHAAVLFAEGWLRKSFGDLVGLSSDPFFSNPSQANSAEAIYGVIAFSLKIYADFSGYTRMAQGVSWLFGVRLVENFNIPYMAQSFKDFWSRWHISLSTWFRDYFYIPIGGNRKGPWRTDLNLMLTMLVSGFWHGASWNFVLWGGLHGSLLLLEKSFHGSFMAIPKRVRQVFVVACAFLAWVPFRAPTFAATLDCYKALFHGGWTAPATSFVVGALGIVLCDMALYQLKTRQVYERRLSALPQAAPDLFRWSERLAAVCVFACMVIWLMNRLAWNNKPAEFIYFQF